MIHALLVALLLASTPSIAMPVQGRVTRAVATGWAQTIRAYFQDPGAKVGELGAILPQLARVDLSEPEAQEALEPVAAEIRTAATSLLAANAVVPSEATLAKLAVLHSAFGAYLADAQRAKIDSAVQLAGLTPEARGRLHARLQEIAEALMKDVSPQSIPIESSANEEDARLETSALTAENLPGRYLLKAQAPDSNDFTVELTIRADGTYDTRMSFNGEFDRMLAMDGRWTLEKGLFVGKNPGRNEQTTEIQLSGLSRAALAKGALVAMKSSQAGRTVTYAFMMAEDVASLPAVDAAPDDGVEMLDLDTLQRLGQGADTELLRRWAGRTVRARGFLAARFESRALGGVVRVFIAAEDGSLEVPLYERAFLRRSKALEHLGSLPVGRAVYALIDANDRSFKVKKLSADSRPAPIALMQGKYASASGFKATAYRAFPGEEIYSIRADGIANGRPSYVQFDFDGATLQAYNIRRTKQDFTLVDFSRGTDGIDTYSFAYGGPFHAWDEKVVLRVHRATGALAGLAVDTKHAKWGLPNGSHSGPIKTQASVFDTGPLLPAP